ncbi:MAG: hypothetical protein ACLQAH_00390, partial [Limisphaerales bacterium]
MKTDTKSKNGNNATAALAELDAKIAELQNQRIGLAQPLIEKHSQTRAELIQLETQIRSLNPTWRPTSLKPRAEERIREIIAGNGGPMTEAEILTAVGNTLTKYKVKQTLK